MHPRSEHQHRETDRGEEREPRRRWVEPAKAGVADHHPRCQLADHHRDEAALADDREHRSSEPGGDDERKHAEGHSASLDLRLNPRVDRRSRARTTTAFPVALLATYGAAVGAGRAPAWVLGAAAAALVLAVAHPVSDRFSTSAALVCLIAAALGIGTQGVASSVLTARAITTSSRAGTT